MATNPLTDAERELIAKGAAATFENQSSIDPRGFMRSARYEFDYDQNMWVFVDRDDTVA